MTHYHEHYDHYTPDMIDRLDGFYGLVEDSIHKKILQNISGTEVLEVGCGFGSLVNYLQNEGFKTTGIDQHAPSITAGRKRFPKANIQLTTDALEILPSRAFDTIVMKDVIHHIYDEDDIDAFLTKIKRLCRKRLIIVDPNPTFILKICRKLIRHDDPVCPPKSAIFHLKKNGFQLKKIFFSDFLAFPLSGGFVGPEWIKSPFLRKWILKMDVIVNQLMQWLKIDRFFCWRYYLVADIA